MKIILPFLLAILIFPFITISQVEQIALLPGSNFYGNYKVKAGNRIFFTDSDGGIWSTDGTAEETLRIADYHGLNNFVQVGDNLIMAIGHRLSKLDAQSLAFTDLEIFDGNIKELVEFQGDFIATTKVDNSPNFQTYIWRYSIATDNTYLITVLDDDITSLVNLDNEILISTKTAIYKSNGAFGNLELLFEGGDEAVEGISLSQGVVLNGVFYFAMDIDTIGSEVWRTDGTASGTYLLKDIRPGFWSSGNGKGSSPDHFMTKGNTVYFSVYNEDGYELFETDGTASGTVPAVSLGDDFGIYQVKEFFKYKNEFYFQGMNPKFGFEWWKTDGSADGTALIRDIWKGAGDMRSDNFHIDISKGDNFLYFKAIDNTHGQEIWRSDGTETGTRMVKDMTPGADFTPSVLLYNLGDQFYFIRGNKETGFSLWKVDENQPLKEPKEFEIDYEWFRSFGHTMTYNRNILQHDALIIDHDDNIYVSGEMQELYLSFFDSNNFIETKTGSEGFRRNFIASFDEGGAFRWGKQLGGESFSSKQRIAVDRENNLIVAGTFKEKAIFDSTFVYSSGGRMYLSKLDKEGNTLWIRQAHVGEYNRGEVNQVITDQSDNIYVAGCYSNFFARFGNFQINAEMSPAYFLVKYDKNGNELWAKTLEFPSVDLHGSVKSLMIDSNNRIYSVISDGGYGWSSTCEYSDWVTRVIAMGSEGDELWQKEFVSDDFTHISQAKMSPDGVIYMLGRFRGNFELDAQSLQTDCEKSGGFLIKLDSMGNVIKTKSYLTDEIYPYDIEFGNNDTYYISGRQVLESVTPYESNFFWNKKNKTFVKKYDKYDKLLEEKLLGKIHQEWYNSNPLIVLDSEEKVIMGDNYSYSLDTIANCVRNSNQQIYAMKFSMDTEPYYSEDVKLAADEVMISPNPARDYLRVYSEDEDFQNARLEVFDSNGCLVRSIVENYNFGYKVVDVNQLSQGVYLLRFNSGNKSITKKFIKQ